MKSELVAGMAALVDGPAPAEVLAVRGDVVVVRVGDVVLKAHERGTDRAALTARLEVAGDPRLGELLLAPSAAPAEVLGRVVTAWPLGVPVPQDVDALPLEAAGRLLADLHRFGRADFAHPVPPAGARPRMERAVRDLPDVPGAGQVRRAFAALAPALGSADGDTLVHGDWHLGQLVERGGWRLIDVDDLGLGDPAWDLARPAALFASGVLDPGSWSRLLTAYLDAGGTAVRRDDPWERLDVPARALVVQMAARALAAAERDDKPLNEAQEALMDACTRIASEHEPIPRG
ncbi:phosphotransferase [Actinosynnema sp. NPDC050436]|uniref:phosphotransferase family protein n=1 Tax=Actinosynnema sp. NPDC050436 TaxID=3155659 RepID=UPI0033CEA1BA